jgi:hypothetical protein
VLAAQTVQLREQRDRIEGAAVDAHRLAVLEADDDVLGLGLRLLRRLRHLEDV